MSDDAPLPDNTPERNEPPTLPTAIAVTDRPWTPAIGAALCAEIPAGSDTMISIHVRKEQP
ncbi:MAG TPA: hypothetical protein VF614_01000 [Chthoniobacteraceae bacterium]|jgi:hypothetical protein